MDFPKSKYFLALCLATHEMYRPGTSRKYRHRSATSAVGEDGGFLTFSLAGQAY
jgi:hypothetical protein